LALAPDGTCVRRRRRSHCPASNGATRCGEGIDARSGSASRFRPRWRLILFALIYEHVQSDVITVTDYSVRLGRALREVGPAVIEGEVQNFRQPLVAVGVFVGSPTKSIRRGVFHSVPDLIAAIDTYLQVTNENPEPVIWTQTAEQILAKSTARV
jgi:hypothetical protein